MEQPLFEPSDDTMAILAVFRTLPYGGAMTYEELSTQVRFRVTNGNPRYRSAVDKALREGISICAHEHNVSFRRRNADEMAEGKHRFKRIRNQARRGTHEAKEALKSNDKRTQAKASVAAAKYALLSATKAVSNRDVPDDRI